VWRAEAPGGIQKAVKIVYGYYDDEFASQELKALERIKGVRHPFLLSLERFEVLNGRLAILTELADMSLDQRLRQCRVEGLAGIPRDELLRYMADAAEALDFLSQKHNLLHLDIKPENLLVLGDHIKVADFGLVKELASRTQNSLVSGMTPTYAAPEVFDDDPSAFSDQYSLAIVYQEMLVGALPFPGRTAAQLAKQHTQAEPQLTLAPIEDRPVLARALAKNPTDRYPSCKAFVAALVCSAKTPSVIAEIPPPPRSTPVPPRPITPESDDTKPPSFCTTLRRSPGKKLDPLEATVTQPVRRDKPVAAAPRVEAPTANEPFVPEETVDVPVPPIREDFQREQPTLYVAAGGVGIHVLCRLLALRSHRNDADGPRGADEAIAFDTDRDELREACSGRWKAPLAPDDALHLPLRLPSSYDNSREILGWVSRRWLYNIPRSFETRGYRPLGRVALVDNSQRALALIDQKLERLAKLAGSTNAAGELRDTTVKVVLLAGTGGGTGAGMVIDIANAVKSLAASRNLPVEVHGYLVCTCFANCNSSPLVAANTYSLLAELSHVATHGNERSGEKTREAAPFESGESPFDSVYWVPARARSKEVQTADALDTLANYLALNEVPEARAALQSCRHSKTPREQLRGQSLAIRKLGYASLADQNHIFIGELAADLVHEVKRHWLSPDITADWVELVAEAQQAASTPKLRPPGDGDKNALPTVVSVNEAAPLALRARFNEHMSLEFASEVLRQVQHQLESRDDCGRPPILPRDAKVIADAARNVVDSLARSVEPESRVANQRADSPVLHKLATAASRRVVSHAVAMFDLKQPERFLPAEAIDELIQAECQALVEESLAQSATAASIRALTDLGQATSATLESASADFLACGSDRRTLIFTPRDDVRSPPVEGLRKERPLAAVVPAAVDDVLVVSEEAGVSPRSLALRLERVFPGIVDAARRLHTRTDIDWQKLN
ncbi:MAG: tubulin-like doman-containing protein, partial [Burkholderiales bacterium]